VNIDLSMDIVLLLFSSHFKFNLILSCFILFNIGLFILFILFYFIFSILFYFYVSFYFLFFIFILIIFCLLFILFHFIPISKICI